MTKKITAILLSLFLLFTCISPAINAGDHPKTITIAYENSDYYPWSMPDGSGLDIELLKLVAKRMKFKIKLITLPWGKCLQGLKENKFDAVLNASYSPERAEYAQYPLTNKTVAIDQRMHMDSYYLYKVKGNPVEWKDGKVIGYDGPIIAQKDYSVAKILRNAGANVVEMPLAMREILDQMADGKIKVAAINGFSADFYLQKNQTYAKTIERAKGQIVFKPYYLIFSKKIYYQNPGFVQRIWGNIRNIRTTAQYSQLLKNYFDK